MKNWIITFLLSLAVFAAGAQENAGFTLSVSTDSLLMGNRLQVVFTLENAQATDFRPPSFEGFYIVSGPNMSSSFSMINGEVTQRASYTYYLEPVDAGNFFIEPASVQVGDTFLETEPKEILVVPNPDGIRQELPDMDGGFEFRFGEKLLPPPLFREGEPARPRPQEKKKRKTYKL